MAEIVIDPEVPAAARHELAQAPLSALLGFGDPPPRGSRSAEVEDEDDAGPATPGARLAARGILVVAMVLGVVGLCLPGPFSGDLVFTALLVVMPCAALGFLHVALQNRASGTRLEPPPRLGVPAAYHRRYVVPALDLRGDELSRWRRASEAARSIRASEAVRLGLIDTVPVTAVLPYHLWEVAERLALLSGPERRQEAILAGLYPDDPGADDPDLRAVLEPQRRVRELAVADIERRIGRLEEFAALAGRVDTARRRQRAIEELAKLNPDYEELLVRLGEPDDGTLAVADASAEELHAVAAAADDAVRRANEAGRSLIIPPAAVASE